MPDRDVVISGWGIVSSLGDEPVAWAKTLAAGSRGFRPVEGFDFEDAGLRALEAAHMPTFDPVRYLGAGNLRPLDRTSRLAASAAAQALRSAGWNDAAERADKEIGLVLGTMFGSVHTISAFDVRAQSAGPSYAKPLDFANSVINAAAGQTAIWHGLRGVNSTVAGGPTASLKAIASATDLIEHGRLEVILAGGAEELAYEAWVGFAGAGLLAGSANGALPCSVPFGAGRNGFRLGEGAALLVLEADESAIARGARRLGFIRGHGGAFDPSRGEDTDALADALARAIRGALAAADLGPGAIDMVSSSASGSPHRDRAEAAAIASTVRPDVPVVAVKAALGECLGAAGALQTAAVLAAATTGEIPGIAGLASVGDDIVLEALSSSPRRGPVRFGLITALGLDGNAEALIVEGADA